MARRITYLVAIAAIAAATAGCASPMSRFYTLASTATAGDAPATRYSILVGPVTIPASVDRPQFVVQVAPNRVEVDEFNRWAAPLNDSIARVVAGDLMALLGTTDVTTTMVANFLPAYRVTIAVQRFESIQGEAALVDAIWVVFKSADGKTRSGHTIAREAAQGQGFDALAAAHSRALATVSNDIAAAIREEAARKREEATRKNKK